MEVGSRRRSKSVEVGSRRKSVEVGSRWRSAESVQVGLQAVEVDVRVNCGVVCRS